MCVCGAGCVCDAGMSGCVCDAGMASCVCDAGMSSCVCDAGMAGEFGKIGLCMADEFGKVSRVEVLGGKIGIGLDIEVDGIGPNREG